MVDNIPVSLESLEYYRKREVYEKKLETSEKVRHYFGGLIKKWVDSKVNTLEIPLITNLFSNQAEKFEQDLKNFELFIGEDNLIAYLEELNGPTQPDEIFKKMKSLIFEMHVYAEIRKQGAKSIKKKKDIGDWETENKIVSVKSKLDLDLNYQMIENFLRSFFYVKEYDIIRKYKSITLNGIRECNDSFRTNLLEYLRNNLIPILEKHDVMELQFPESTNIVKYTFGNLTISVDTYVEFTKVKIINIHCMTSDMISEINILFRKKIDDISCYSIQFGTNVFWIDDISNNEDSLLKAIKCHVIKFDDEYRKYRGPLSFEGWIALSAHPKDDNYFLKYLDNFKSKIKEITNNLNYKIYLLIIPQMDFDNRGKQLLPIC